LPAQRIPSLYFCPDADASVEVRSRVIESKRSHFLYGIKTDPTKNTGHKKGDSMTITLDTFWIQYILGAVNLILVLIVMRRVEKLVERLTDAKT